MVDLKASLQGLQDKLQILIKQYGLLEKENLQLKTALTKQENWISNLEEKLKEKEGQTAAAMLLKSDMDPVQKQKMVNKIDQYIKEIDQSIKNLNT